MSVRVNSGNTMKIVGRIAVVAALAAGIVLSGKFTRLMNVPGLVFVVVGCAAMILIGYSLEEILSAFKHAFGKEGSRRALKKSVDFWKSAVRNAFMVGVLGTLMGYVIQMRALKGIATLFGAVGTRFLSTIYGLILAAIFAVPVTVLSRRLNGLTESSQESDFESQGTDLEVGDEFARESGSGRLAFSSVFGYALFIALMVLIALAAPAVDHSPLPPMWLFFFYWPSLLVVAGGALALLLFMGDIRKGQNVVLSFGFAGLIGSLVGLVQTLQGMSFGRIQDVAAAITFIVSSCFISLIGMMLIGVPLEDRAFSGTEDLPFKKRSLIACYGFPLVTLLYLALITILIVTPIRKNVGLP